jgi:rhomboid family GlyGly-CTERM serine protease
VSRGAAAWVVSSLALALAASLAFFAPRGALDWQPTRALTEPWRVWTAAFVHWTPWHLAANAIGCAVVAAFGWAAQVPPRSLLAWLAAWPLTHLALALQPTLVSYGGLSGVLHAGVAVAAWQPLRRAPGRARMLGALVLIGLAVKIVLEAPWDAPTQTLPGWDFPVAPLAHATGALAGLLCAALADAFRSRPA